MSIAVEILPDALVATAIGAIAARGLAASGGWAFPLAEFPDAPYLRAGSEIIWIGDPALLDEGAMHPRMVLTQSAARRGRSVRIDTRSATTWQPTPLSIARGAMSGFVSRAAKLKAAIRDVGVPRGLGPLLIGETPLFPLHLAEGHIRKVAGLISDDDANALTAAARPLLGMGTGLTPSGDDFIGGLLFARRLVAPGPMLDRAITVLVEAAAERTHVISAALLGDLARGAGYQRLHTVALDLINATPISSTASSASRLVRIGHSSGWDMLTGFLLGATGTLHTLR